MSTPRITVDGITFVARPEFGGWYEADDPTPSGSVGRLYIPMMLDGAPASDEPVEIEVTYEEA